MNCPNCSAAHPDAARFCARCGTPLHPSIDRGRHFAALPDEPVRALAVMSTLMPHLSAGRSVVYRNALGLALTAAWIAAAFGLLSIALVIAAVAVPAVLFAYIYDHDLWRGRPLAVLGGGFALPLVLGVAVGLLQQRFAPSALLSVGPRHLPSVSTILELGVIVPVVVFLALLVAPLLITAPAAFRHPVDAIVACSLSGAALSLGFSIVVQRGAFTEVAVTIGNPAQLAFIALTLGFLQPIVFATASAVTVIRLREATGKLAVGVVLGLALVVAYQLAATLLTPYGTRGVVLTALVGFVLAAVGLVTARTELHKGLLGEAQEALGERTLIHPAQTGQICAHCGAAMVADAAFCQVCGTASAALSRYVRVTTAKTEKPSA